MYEEKDLYESIDGVDPAQLRHLGEFVEKVESAYAAFFGLLMLFAASFILMINEVNTSSQSTLLHQAPEQVVSIKANETVGPDDLVIVKKAEHSAAVILQSEESANSSEKWPARAGGLIFMLVTAMILRQRLVKIVRKLPGLSTFAVKETTNTTFILGVGLTAMAIILGWIIAYVPFIGYIIMALLAFGSLYLVRRLSRSKSMIGKIFFILMVLIIVIIVIAIIAFLYLTRAEV